MIFPHSGQSRLTIRIRVIARLDIRLPSNATRVRRIFHQRQEVEDQDQQAAALGAVQHRPVLDGPVEQDRLADRTDVSGLGADHHVVFIRLGGSGAELCGSSIEYVSAIVYSYCNGRSLCPFGPAFRSIRNQTRRGHLIAFLDVHQPHALRRPARLPDLARIDADDLALLGDDHQLGIFLHRENARPLCRCAAWSSC